MVHCLQRDYSVSILEYYAHSTLATERLVSLLVCMSTTLTTYCLQRGYSVSI